MIVLHSNSPIGVLLVLVCALIVGTHSAPTPTPAAAISTTSVSATSQPLDNRRGVVENDEQLEALIAQLEQQERDSIKSNPLNYVADDVPIEQLIAALEGAALAASAATTTSAEPQSATTPLPFAEQQAEELLDSIDRATREQLDRSSSDSESRPANGDDSDDDGAQLDRVQRRRRQLISAEAELIQTHGEPTTTGPLETPTEAEPRAEAAPRAVFTSDFVDDDVHLADIIRMIESGQQLEAATDEQRPVREPFAVPTEYTDAEYAQLLEQLKREAIESLQHPDNFARDDDDLQRIIDYIESHEHEICPICHDELAAGDDDVTVQIENCGHSFHHQCLDDWFRSIEGRHLAARSRHCPYCRQMYPARAVTTRRRL